MLDLNELLIIVFLGNSNSDLCLKILRHTQNSCKNIKLDTMTVGGSILVYNDDSFILLK